MSKNNGKIYSTLNKQKNKTNCENVVKYVKEKKIMVVNIKLKYMVKK